MSPLLSGLWRDLDFRFVSKIFMEETVVRKLIELNSTFYEQFAVPFSASRSKPQPGYDRLLAFIPPGRVEVLDAGCGNGRFGRFLVANGVSANYTGIDLFEPLPAFADDISIRFFRRDLSRPDCLAGFGSFDLIVSLSTLQHIPGRVNREHLLCGFGDHLATGGRIVLGNWQFLNNPRQQRKIRPWSEVGLASTQLETGDYLLSWERGGYGLRYVASLDVEETRLLAKRAGLKVIDQFRSDGREGNLNLYTILAC